MRADKSLSPFEIRLYRHYRVVHGVRIALAFLFTFLLVRLLNIPEGTWPLITLVVIMGPISFGGTLSPEHLSVLAEQFWDRYLGWWPFVWSSFHFR